MAQSATPLTLRLFGAPEIDVQGRSLPLKNQKARALLFYLAVTRQAHTRTHLATLLWSEYPAAKAGGSLRSTLFQLRKALRSVKLPEVVTSQGDLLAWQLSGKACDVTHFCELITADSEATLKQAVNLYRGALLEGFSLPDTPIFDEWLRLEDESLRQSYLQALQRLVEKTAVRQQWEQTLTYLQRLVQADPLAENAQQQLIRLYLQRDAVSQALQQYHHFESHLQQKMSLSPSPETKALFQEGLRRQQSQRPLNLAAKQAPVKRSQPTLPFVGRDDLLDRLHTISRKVQTGQGHTVLLQGDGGSGKTRLLHEFLIKRHEQDATWLILQGACSPFDDLISFGPFLEAFQETPLGDLTDQLLTPETDAPSDREQFIYRFLQTLRRLSHNAPLLLTIEDLQWANSSTLNLFGLLATRLHHLPILLVGTAQRPDTIPALQRLITLERRRGQLQLLTLAPLPETAVSQLLQKLSIVPAAIPSLAPWLQERSDGNPFILDEIMAQLQAESILTPLGEQWQLDSGRWLRWRATYTFPETTHDLVSWRLRKLKREAHILLELLAVAGQPLPFILLADVSGLDNHHLLPFLDDLLTRGLIRETGGERFTLSHYLLRETILQRLSHVRRRLLHRQLAQALAGCPLLKDNIPLWEIARHAVIGEDITLARQYGLQILPQLPRDHTGAVTVDFLHHLYDLLAPSAAAEEMLRLRRSLADVYQSLGQLPEAAHWQQQYLALARQTGDIAAQAAAYLEKGELALISNDYMTATEAAGAGLAACALLPETNPGFSRFSGRGHRLLGHALAMEGSDLQAAERHLLEATAVHRQANHWRDLCAALFELGNIAAQRGELFSALTFYEEAGQVAKAGQVHYFHALVHNNIAYHNLLLGRLNPARQALAFGQKLAEDHELLGALLHLSGTQGEIHLYLAEWEAAAEAFQRGLQLAETLGNPERQAGNQAGLALAARGQHDWDTAVALLEEALLLISGHGYWHLRSRLLIWLAETLYRAKRFSEVPPRLTIAREMVRTYHQALLQLQAERLQAALLATAGQWPAAEHCFRQTADRAAALELPLEVARTQAAWGLTAVHYAPAAPQSRTLLTQARQVFTAHQAQAELLYYQSPPQITAQITLR